MDGNPGQIGMRVEVVDGWKSRTDWDSNWVEDGNQYIGMRTEVDDF